MPTHIDIISLGEQKSTKFLLTDIKRAFGKSNVVSTIRIQAPSEYATRSQIIFRGAVLVNFDDGNISKNSDYSKRWRAKIQALRQQFPLTPIALRSAQFDPNKSSEYQENELKWRETAQFDFALAKDPSTHSHEYVAQLLKNAFDRYNSLNIGSATIQLHSQTVKFKGKIFTLSKPQLDTLLVISKRSHEFSSAAQLIHRQNTPARSPSSMRKRIQRLKQTLTLNDLPDLVESHLQNGTLRHRVVPPSFN